MKPLLFAAFFFFTSGIRAADDGWPEDLRKETNQADHLGQDAKTPGLTPEAVAAIERQRQEAVKKIETIADKRPDNPDAQLAVGNALASVHEAPRAIPYAESGLKLAETSGDQKLIRTALLTGSEIYYKAGNYELARDRAQRILKNNPRDKDALALYMQVKDRGASSAAAPTGGATATAGSAGQAAQGQTANAQASAPRGPAVAMTSASSLEAQKQIATGWSRIKLDPAAALKNFDAAVAADPKSAAARVQRSKARLEAGDAPGAIKDADDAAALEPRFGAAYAARAEANRAMAKADVALLADYEKAAKLDGHFADAYASALLRANDAAPRGDDKFKAALRRSAAAAADDPAHRPPSPPSRPPLSLGMLILIGVFAGGLGCVLAPLILRRRRSGEDDSLPR